MKFSMYLKSAVWEYLLLVAASAALAYTLFDDFYIRPDLQYGIIPAMVVAAVLALLFCVAFNNRTARWGGIAFSLAAVAAIAVSASTAGGRPFLDDFEGNLFYFTMICVLVPVLAFLLSRKRVGAVLLCVFGSFACAWTQFFYERFELVLLLLFLVASLALVVYKNYQLSAYSVASTRGVSFGAGALVALASVLLSVGVGCGIWFGIIQQFHPGAIAIELVNEDRALEEVPVRGVSNVYQTPNLEMTSDQTNDRVRTTDDLLIDENGQPVAAHVNDSSPDDEVATGSYQGQDLESQQDSFDFQTSEEASLVEWIVLGLLLLLALAYFVGRRIWRRVRLARIQRGSASSQVMQLYPFLMDRLGRLGITLPAGTTIGEFAVSNSNSIERLDAVTGVSFAALTAAYADTVYGGNAASQEDADHFAKYYRGFWKAARKYLGSFKYFTKSFRL